MKCSFCETDNRKEATYCDHCGRLLDRFIVERSCIQCFSLIPDGGGSCLICGIPYIEPIVSHKRLSCIAVKVGGLEELLEEGDVEQVQSVLNQFLTAVFSIAQQFGGIVDQMAGTQFRIVMGLIEPLNPEQAIWAALGLLEKAKGVGDELSLPLYLKIGISTDQLVAALLGPTHLKQYAYIGEGVNRAIQLRESAANDQILLDEESYLAVNDIFRCDIREGDGKEMPIYIVGEETELIELEKSVYLFGREEIADQIKGLLPTERAASVGIIEGASGIGKSSLLQLVQADSTLLWYRIEVSPLMVHQPYSIWKRLLTLCFGWQVEDELAVRGEKMERFLERYLPEEVDSLKRLLGILFFKKVDEEGAIDGVSWQNEFFTFISDLLIQISQQQRSVLLFEEIDLADDESKILLERLLPMSKRYPISFLLTREGDEWADDPLSRLAERVEVGPLSLLASEQLISILSKEPVSEEKAGKIQEKSKGNPLMIQELLATLQLHPGLEIDQFPEKIDALMQARIHQIGAELASFIQLASFLEDSFKISDLSEILSYSVDRSEIELLVGRAFFVQQQKGRYRLAHPLLGEVAYKMVQRKQKQIWHQHVAKLLERQDADYGVIGWHYFQAGVYRDAYRYTILAADWATGLGGYKSGIKQYRQALSLSHQTAVSDEELNHLYQQLGYLLEEEQQVEEAYQLYSELSRIGKVRNQASLELIGLIGQARLLVQSSLPDEKEAEEKIEQAIELARNLADLKGEAALWLLRAQRFNPMSGINEIDFAQFQEYGETGLAVAAELKDEALIGTISFEIGYRLLFVGKIEEGKKYLEDGVAYFAEHNQLLRLYDGSNYLGLAQFWLGQYDEGLRKIKEGYEQSLKLHYLLGMGDSILYRSWIEIELGSFGETITQLQHFIDLGEENGLELIEYKAYLLHAYIELGAFIEAAEICAQFPDWKNEKRLDFWWGVAYGEMARFYMRSAQIGRAIELMEWLKKEAVFSSLMPITIPFFILQVEIELSKKEYRVAYQTADLLLDQMEQMGILAYQYELFYLQAEALIGLGEEETARQILMQAAAETAVLQARRVGWRILLRLAELSPREEAHYLQSKAEDMIEFIVAGLNDRRLEKQFLEMIR